MTSPRSTYGGGYYTAPSFPDTPIYDSLVAERGTPQIAPIRVPSAYDTGNGYAGSSSYLPALPAALPALPAAPTPQPGYGGHGGYGYPQPAQQMAPAAPAPATQLMAPVPLQSAPTPYIPQQTAASRGYGYPGPQAPQQPRPTAAGYEAMRPAAPRPAAPGPYEDPYNRPYQGRGY
ncbi:DUF6643 family protein [Streptomyces roseicoloratus]|uniref:DUF6643 family protein n=1 Tax=Streptomyces roseicoloratus TaxID=2508722 RepID=UPI001009AC09|nr:DUF6643 family protein [Streptomyces roseicoloratus]